MIVQLSNVKVFIFIFLFIFLISCSFEKKESVTNIPIPDSELMDKFCSLKNPNYEPDILKYLPLKTIHAQKNRDLFIDYKDFLEKIKKLENINIYENEGYLDILDSNYQVLARVNINSEGGRVNMIYVEVDDNVEFFNRNDLKGVLLYINSIILKGVNKNNILNELTLGIVNKDNAEGLNYISSVKVDDIYFKMIQFSPDLVVNKIKSGELRDIDCNRKSYMEYKDLKSSLFVIY